MSIFLLDFKVRDYECDIQGIVNNASYMHYLEHTRHEYLAKMGLNFKELSDKGIYLVATEVKMEYKQSLLPGEKFYVTCAMARESRCRVKFTQEIYNEKNQKNLFATTLAAAIDVNKKPIALEKIIDF